MVFQVSSPVVNSQNVSRISTTKKPRIIQTDSGTKKGELAPQDPDPDQEIMKFLVKDLKDEDFIMETPLAAYFTLITGKF